MAALMILVAIFTSEILHIALFVKTHLIDIADADALACEPLRLLRFRRIVSRISKAVLA